MKLITLALLFFYAFNSFAAEKMSCDMKLLGMDKPKSVDSTYTKTFIIGWQELDSILDRMEEDYTDLGLAQEAIMSIVERPEYLSECKNMVIYGNGDKQVSRRPVCTQVKPGDFGTTICYYYTDAGYFMTFVDSGLESVTVIFSRHD